MEQGREGWRREEMWIEIGKEKKVCAEISVVGRGRFSSPSRSLRLSWLALSLSLLRCSENAPPLSLRPLDRLSLSLAGGLRHREDPIAAEKPLESAPQAPRRQRYKK